MAIKLIFYNEKFKIGLLELIFEGITGLFFLFTVMTSTDFCLLCKCLKKYTRSAISQRAIDDSPDELYSVGEEEEEKGENEQKEQYELKAFIKKLNIYLLKKLLNISLNYYYIIEDII